MINRRQFLFNTGLTAAGAMLGADVFAHGFNKSKVGIQLYTLRDDLKALGLDGVFKKIATAGYNSVEMFGYSPKESFFGNDAKKVAELLKANNLVSPSGHYWLDFFETDGQQLIDTARALGHSYIVIPWFLPEQRDTLDKFKKIAERLNKAGELCKQNEIKLAYHNHDFEFLVSEDGVSGYDILLNDVDKSLMDFELDLFWAVTAGHDPVELFKKNPGRFKMWHVKDKDKTNPKLNTEIGSGSIDFKKIFANADVSGLEYFYVEQENFAIDSTESIRKSSSYVKKQLLGTVKRKK